jgi:hypothetical protein
MSRKYRESIESGELSTSIGNESPDSTSSLAALSGASDEERPDV